jgi:hypothetical protein
VKACSTIQSLSPVAAPATAVLLMGALFILEERHFDQKNALLFALPQRRRCDGVEGSIQERGCSRPSATSKKASVRLG